MSSSSGFYVKYQLPPKSVCLALATCSCVFGHLDLSQAAQKDTLAANATVGVAAVSATGVGATHGEDRSAGAQQLSADVDININTDYEAAEAAVGSESRRQSAALPRATSEPELRYNVVVPSAVDESSLADVASHRAGLSAQWDVAQLAVPSVDSPNGGAAFGLPIQWNALQGQPSYGGFPGSAPLPATSAGPGTWVMMWVPYGAPMAPVSPGGLVATPNIAAQLGYPSSALPSSYGQTPGAIAPLAGAAGMPQAYGAIAPQAFPQAQAPFASAPTAPYPISPLGQGNPAVAQPYGAPYAQSLVQPQLYGQYPAGSLGQSVPIVAQPYGAPYAQSPVQPQPYSQYPAGPLGQSVPIVAQPYVGQYLPGAVQPQPYAQYPAGQLGQGTYLAPQLRNGGFGQSIPVPTVPGNSNGVPPLPSPPPNAAPVPPATIVPGGNPLPYVPDSGSSNLTNTTAQTPPATSSAFLAPPRGPLSDPTLELQGLYILQGDASSARARLNGSAFLTPNLVIGGALDVVTGEGLTNDDGVQLTELYAAASFPGVPGLRFRFGQLDLTSYFDRNSFAKDASRDFFNSTFQTNPALFAGANVTASRPAGLVQWAVTDSIGLTAGIFSSDADIGDFDLDGFGAEASFRTGDLIVRGTFLSSRDTDFQATDDRIEAYGVNAEWFFPAIDVGIFGRYGQVSNPDSDFDADTYSIGLNALDLFMEDDRLGFAYGRNLDFDANDGETPDVWEVFYDFELVPDIRAGFTFQQRNSFTESFAGFRIRGDLDLIPSLSLD